jgi:transposase, IS30 family
MEKYHHLTLARRVEIKVLSSQGMGVRGISRSLACSASSVSRELKRNAVGAAYDAGAAHARALQRRRRGGRKLKPGVPLWDTLVKQLQDAWSPEQISQRLRILHSTNARERVSDTTIYRAIYALPKGELKKDLLSCLRQAGRKRRPGSGGKKRAEILKNITPIQARPEEVAARIIPGHWEADLVKGAGNRSAVATIVERVSRLTIIAALPDAKASSVLAALTQALGQQPAGMCRTLTYDRGTEMAQHEELAKRLKIDVYFCDPHAPWQRGTNENTNGLIRQYLPKGTDLSVYPQTYLNDIARALNTRPRRALGFLTPLEKYTILLSEHAI